MSDPKVPNDDRLEELLVKGALEGLSVREANEVTVRGGAFDESFAVAAAALDLVTLPLEEMPASLRARLLAQAELGPSASLPPRGNATVPMLPSAMSRSAGPRRDWTRYAGWLAAAALLALFVTTWHDGGLRGRTVGESNVADSKPSALSPSDERARLLATAKDAVVLPWSPTKDATAAHAEGDVVWSQTEQRGFMRFHGLAANDKTKLTYQLWIFDKNQDYPVDGGIFDVSSDGDLVVPIHSKLQVGTPTLFAVTVEKPGGVVVSKKERIVVTAAVRG